MSDDLNIPVTVSVKRIVIQEYQHVFEKQLEDVVKTIKKFDGFLSIDIIRPISTDTLEYDVILKFDSFESLYKWRDSQERKNWNTLAEESTAFGPEINVVKGFENWFIIPHKQEQIPMWKMDFITWLAIYPLICGLILLLRPVLAVTPMLVDNLILTIILIPLLSRIVMPRMIRLFAKWLKK